MRIESLSINKFRAFQNSVSLALGKNITCISGVNGVGKSTILAILSNIGEIRGFHTLTGQPFRGEFANVVLFDSDHDTQGNNKVAIKFTDSIFEEDKLSFRATKQKSHEKIRYRLIPQKTMLRKTEAKLSWPSYYLTLSRLVPVGESDTAKQSQLPLDIEREILEKHRFIMKESFDPKAENVSAQNVRAATQKQENFGINTSQYSATSNSSGQDNLGQILRSVWSFRRLKSQMGADFNGGILCIDELDAALHPGAQNLLFDFLLSETERVGYQIVFTTHSLSLLHHIVERQHVEHIGESIQTIYFNRNGVTKDVDILKNPALSFIRYGLMSTFDEGTKNNQVQLLMEDSVARRLFKRMIRNSTFKNVQELYEMNFLNISIAWNSLISLAVNDNDLYNKSIIVLDGDLHQKKQCESLQDSLANAPFNINSDQNKSHLFLLPTQKAIETELVEYSLNSNLSKDFYNTPSVYNRGLSPDKLKDRIAEMFPDGPSKTDHFKSIFKGPLKQFQNELMDSWTISNIDSVNALLKQIYESYKKIQSELWPY